MNTIVPIPMSAEPTVPRISLSVPELAGNEWRYVKQCLDSNWVSSAGPFVDRFEQDFSVYVGSPHAVAVVNGTAALHVALRLAGVKAEDEVLVSTLTFIAPANAIRYLGAHPIFVDAEPDFWQMDVNRVADFVTKDCHFDGNVLRNRSTNRRVKALLPVHILGHPVDIDALVEIARAFRLAVIEDATESLGALCRDRTVGTSGLFGCFSFNGNKLLTCGGGGMMVTAHSSLAERARYLTTQAKDSALEYVHSEVGYNFRLTNVAAALGSAQLERVDRLLDAKRRIASTYAAAFASVPGLTAMPEAPWARSACWLSAILVKEGEFGLDSRALQRRLAGEGIDSRPLWQPLHLSPAHRGGQMLGGRVAEQLHAQVLCLPSSSGLTQREQQRVIDKTTAA